MPKEWDLKIQYLPTTAAMIPLMQADGTEGRKYVGGNDTEIQHEDRHRQYTLSLQTKAHLHRYTSALLLVVSKLNRRGCNY